MTAAVLAVLAGLWLGYFVLWLRESRNPTSTRPESMNAFSHALGALARPMTEQRGQNRASGRGEEADGSRPVRPGVLGPPGSLSEATRRRRRLLAMLAAVALASLMAVPSLGPAALAVHLLAVLALAAIVGMVAVRHARSRAREAVPAGESNVRVLYPQRPAFEEDGLEDGVVVPLRRVADG